ncbi:hypothetical protein [Chryseosolibacter indicus]|uniref:Uncharacterized protein n=1 Tax=Chryseosolibacter indicus TaxID=2782351 RepID=A0ABS5VPM3_9BACT|nr:hypothetical protein [Chryseosolibacter indicus]MBT1703389.1 hypothetical protein [Chryseosolibacter indicus]
MDTIAYATSSPYLLKKQNDGKGYRVHLQDTYLSNFKFSTLDVVFNNSGGSTIGNGFLQHYIVTFDFIDKTIYLFPNDHGATLDASIE